ncbi:MAG: transcriptional regulator, family [Rhizobium sp.]|nr:transcriptional regulator, family [Rhizobium sp.]
MAKTKGTSSLSEAIRETADGMFKSGILDEESYHRITLRHLPDEEKAIEIPVPTGEDIRAMREKANLSQAVFARKLNLSTGYVSQLERGIKRPSGPALVLLNLIRKRGIEAIQ